MRKLVSKIALAAAGVLVALVLTEAALTLFWPITPMPSFKGLMERDPELGQKFIPGARKVVVGTFNDFRVPIHINAHGFRFPEPPMERGPDVCRIALFGDSEVFGTGVQDGETLDRAMERCLNASSGRVCQVLNFAIPGTGPTVSGKVLQRYALEWTPDVVIVLVTAVNDLGDEYRYAHRATGTVAAASAAPRSLRKRLACLNVVTLLKYKVGPRLPAWIGRRLPGSRTPSQYIDEWYVSGHRDESVELMTRALEGIRATCASRGIRMVLAVLPARGQYDPWFEDMLRRTTAARILAEFLADPERPQRILGAWAEQAGVPFVPVLDPFRARVREGVSLKYPNDGHLNARGTLELANLLARAVLESRP